jgi:hypothetical protein
VHFVQYNPASTLLCLNFLESGSFEKENFAWVDQAHTGGTVVSRRM